MALRPTCHRRSPEKKEAGLQDLSLFITPHWAYSPCGRSSIQCNLSGQAPSLQKTLI